MSGKKSSRVVLPSKNEQLSLQNTEILLKSNLMRMQLGELLSNVRDSETSSKHGKIDRWLEKVLDVLKDCGVEEEELSGKWLAKRNLQGFSLDGNGGKDVSFSFEKPSSVQVIGSHALKSGTAPFLNCDIAVVMPKSCFDSRDVLNHVYFNKRKLYLAALSEVLSASGLSSGIEVSYFKADHRKPFLIVKPNFVTKYSVHLYPCAPPAVFKLVQLVSSKNCVRPEAWMRELQLRRAEPANGKKGSKVKPAREENLDASSLPPTPHYNMALLEDLAIVPQHRMLSKASEACPCFKDTCMLLKVWLAQKNLRFGVNDLGGHCTQIIVAYLFQTRRIGQQTSVLGAFQIVLSFFADTNFAAADLYFAGGDTSKNDGSWAAKLYHPIGKDADDVQFNSLWRVSSSAMQDLRNESKIALSLLQLDTEVSFSRLFLEGRHYLSRYDLIFHIPLASFAASDDSTDAASRGEEEDMTVPQYLASRVLSVTRRALNNRVKGIFTCVRDLGASDSAGASTASTWDRHSPPRSTSESCVVTVGLVIDSEHAYRRVDKGADPSLDGSGSDLVMSAEEFRSFWGRKSEVRRFRDGAIVDAVVWGEQDVESSGSRPREVTGESIVQSIVLYSLGMHFPSCAGSRGELITSMGSSLEESLPAADYVRSSAGQSAPESSSRQRYLHAVEALDKLRSILTSDIKGLPLVFESVTGSSSSLRYTSMLPPVPHPLLLNSKDKLKEHSGVALSLVAQPMLVVGQVEGGGKWPSEVEAARKVKTALLLRTGHLLRVQFEIPSQPTHEHLDIFFNGYIFRLVIFFSSEDIGTGMMRTLQASSLHHQSIRALHTQHSDSFSSSCRLLSLWLSKNHFSGFLSQRQIELLAAATFLDPSSLCAPTTSASALYRILDMLGKHDFEAPLVVYFNPDAAKGHLSKQTARACKIFSAAQKHSQSSLLILSSNDLLEEDEEVLPSDCAVERVTLSLIQKCASESALHLMSKALDDGNTQGCVTSKIFQGSALMVEQCNLVLLFSSSLHCRGSSGHLKGPKFASLKVYANTAHSSCSPSRLVVGETSSSSANIIQEEIVEKLRKQFQDVALFFWDETEGDRLGVILKPSSFVASPFSSTSSRRKISIADGPKAHSPMLADISQIAMNIFASGNGCFSDIIFR